jgi:hypothetical protein
MLNSKDARAKYIAAVLSNPQRPFIWEYFRPGTIPLAGTQEYYDQVGLFRSFDETSSNKLVARNEKVHSSLSLSSVHSPSTIPPTASNPQSHLLILVMGVAQLVPWPLQPQR